MVTPPTRQVDPLVANSLLPALGHGLVELASGIDALYLSGRCELSTQLLRRLDAGKAVARGSEGTAFTLGGEDFTLAGFGLGRYRYRLSHPNGVIGLSGSKSLPAVTVQPLASFLHGVGPSRAVDWFRRVLGSEVGPVEWKVSRVDLFSDWHGWDLTIEDLDRFCCRAREETDHKVDGSLTGVSFGRRKTGTILARIYDKTAEIAKNGADYWPLIWGDAYRPEERVLRVEFEIGRSGLREFRQDSPGQVIANVGDLWASVAEDWLTFRDRTGDTTRSRWPLAAEWTVIQRATLRGQSIGLDRVRAAKNAGSLRLLLPLLFGCLTKFGAIVEVYDLDEALALLHFHIRKYELETDKLYRNHAFGKRLILDDK